MGLMFRNGIFYGGGSNEDEQLINADKNQILVGDGIGWINGSQLYTLKNQVKAYDKKTLLDLEDGSIGHTDYKLICEFNDNDTNPQFIITGNKNIINPQNDEKSGYNQEQEDHNSFNFIIKDQALAYFGGNTNVIADGASEIKLHNGASIQMDGAVLEQGAIDDPKRNPQIKMHGAVGIWMDGNENTGYTYRTNPNFSDGYVWGTSTKNQGSLIDMHDVSVISMNKSATILMHDSSLIDVEGNGYLSLKDNANLSMDSFSQFCMQANRGGGGPTFLMSSNPVFRMDDQSVIDLNGLSTIKMGKEYGEPTILYTSPQEICFSRLNYRKNILKTNSTNSSGLDSTLTQMTDRSPNYERLSNFEYLPGDIVANNLEIDYNCQYYFNSKKPFKSNALEYIKKTCLNKYITLSTLNHKYCYITPEVYDNLTELIGRDFNQTISSSYRLTEGLKIKDLNNLQTLLDNYSDYLTAGNSVSFPNLWKIGIKDNISNWENYFEKVYYQTSNNFEDESYYTAAYYMKKYLGDQYKNYYFTEFGPIYSHALNSSYITYNQYIYTLIAKNRINNIYTQTFNNTEYRFIDTIIKTDAENLLKTDFSVKESLLVNIDGYLCKSGIFDTYTREKPYPTVLFKDNVVFSIEGQEGFVKVNIKPDPYKTVKVNFHNNSYFLEGGNSHLEFLDNSRIIMRGNSGNTQVFSAPWLDGFKYDWITPIKQLDNGAIIGLYDSPTFYMRGKWITDNQDFNGYVEKTVSSYFYIDGDYSNHSTNIENWKTNEPELFEKLNDVISSNSSYIGYLYQSGGTATFKYSSGRTEVTYNNIVLRSTPPDDWNSYMPKKENSPIMEITENSEIRFHQDFILKGDNNGITFSNGEKSIDFSFEELEKLKTILQN